MLVAKDACIRLFQSEQLARLSASRLKAFKKAVYRNKVQFWCECCREYHVDTPEEKAIYEILQKNINAISKAQATGYDSNAR